MLTNSQPSVVPSASAQEAVLLRRALWIALVLHLFILGLFFVSQFWQVNDTSQDPPKPQALAIPLTIEIAQPSIPEPELLLEPKPTPLTQTRDAGRPSSSPVESFIQSSRDSRAGTNRADLAANFERLALNGSQEERANARESERLVGAEDFIEQSEASLAAIAAESEPSNAARILQSSVQLPESDLLEQNALVENPQPEVPQPLSAEQIQRRAQTMRGQLRSDGTSQFDTQETALGAYMERVGEAIAQSWQEAVSERQGNPGKLSLRFRIRASGESTNFEFVGLREAGSVAEDITLESVIQAQLPPIPEEVLAELEQGWMECEYDFLFL